MRRREALRRYASVERKRLALVLVLASALGLGGCKNPRAQEAKSAAPAKVSNPPTETELSTITLTDQAEARIGIELASIERRKVRRARSFGAEVVVPPGRQIVVTSPVTGRIAAAEAAGLPPAGTIVERGRALFKLYELPPESDLLRIREEIAQSEIRLEAARRRAARAVQLLEGRAGSVRAKEEAEAELAGAEEALKAARARLAWQQAARTEAEPPGTTPLLVAAAERGVLIEIHARPGQMVPAGAPLFATVNTETVWIRVPVYVGELATIDRARPAELRTLAAPAGKPGRQAAPVIAPPSANAGASSVDLFYEVANVDGAARPGQRVEVTLSMKESEEALVAPWPAIIFDVYGGAWVYVNTAPRVYTRHRVEVRRVENNLAVLSRGPAPGTRVVRAGAAELFGTEFATGK